jgi:hypothetical protein
MMTMIALMTVSDGHLTLVQEVQHPQMTQM